MTPANISTYVLDCSLFNTRELAKSAIRVAFRFDPDMLVILCEKPPAEWVFELVRYASESGHAVLLTHLKALVPAGASWAQSRQ